MVKELAEACRKQGIAFGTYYSVCDWHHPDFPLTSPGGRTRREKSDLDAYNRYLLGQIRELVDQLRPAGDDLERRAADVRRAAA